MRQGPLLALTFLALLTFSDGIATNALQAILSRSSPQPPGFWNLGTTALIVSTASGKFIGAQHRFEV